MNPESDATAIWLERKFDVPASGSWVSESIFSIPLSSAGGPSATGYPGLIVFECSPLGDITDVLEKYVLFRDLDADALCSPWWVLALRKYRILDDCSRLREIGKALPAKRHFVPSILIISWGDDDQTSTSSDFFDMVRHTLRHIISQYIHSWSRSRNWSPIPYFRAIKYLP